MPRLTARERREGYLREVSYQKKTGKPFFPGAIFHDVLVNFFFICLILALACVWYYTASHGHTPTTGGKNGWLGPLYENKADPAVVSYDPRPEWYFFFLFQLLRVFGNPNLLLLATIIIPTIWMVLLLTIPFIDRRRERRLSRRPISLGFAGAMAILLLVLTYKGSVAPGAQGKLAVLPADAVSLVANAPCASCHTMGAFPGWTGGVGPNLTSGIPYSVAIDRVTNGKGGMPSFKKQGYSAAKLNCFATLVATYSNNGSATKAAGGAKQSPQVACKGVQ